jgi:hypothetical protein
MYPAKDYTQKLDKVINIHETLNNLAFPERTIYTFHDLINGPTEKPNTKEE